MISFSSSVLTSFSSSSSFPNTAFHHFCCSPLQLPYFCPLPNNLSCIGSTNFFCLFRTSCKRTTTAAAAAARIPQTVLRASKGRGHQDTDDQRTGTPQWRTVANLPSPVITEATNLLQIPGGDPVQDDLGKSRDFDLDTEGYDLLGQLTKQTRPLKKLVPPPLKLVPKHPSFSHRAWKRYLEDKADTFMAARKSFQDKQQGQLPQAATLPLNSSYLNVTEKLRKPLIAIVGRPNVGKSTIFNQLTSEKSAPAMVHNEVGVTR